MTDRAISWVFGCAMTGLAAIYLLVPLLARAPVNAAAGHEVPYVGEVCGGAVTDGDESEGARIRIPSDYVATHAYGLLLLMPPAGANARASERYYGLTTQATAAGMAVAYASNPHRLDRADANRPSALLEVLRGKVCVNDRLVVVAGHSDGGTVALMASALGGLPSEVGIVASGIGVQGTDLDGFCPAASRIAIVHSDNDALFPDYGASTVDRLADCMGCVAPPAPAANDCATVTCADRRLTFCRTTDRHAEHPDPDLMMRLVAQITPHD